MSGCTNKGGYSVCRNTPESCIDGSSGTWQYCAPPGQTQSTQAEQTPAVPCDKDCNLNYSPLEPLPGLGNPGSYDFVTMLNLVFKLLITIGALFAVGTFVYSGIIYIVTASTGEVGEARKRMQAAVFGLLLVVGAWLILNTINPELVKFNFNPDSLRNGQSASKAQTAAQTSLQNLSNFNDARDTCAQQHLSPHKQPDGSFTCR